MPDRSRRRTRPMIPLLAVATLLFSAASLAVSLASDLLALGIPEKSDLLGGVAAGFAGFIVVVWGALQRRHFFWLLLGIIGMGTAISLALTRLQG